VISRIDRPIDPGSIAVVIVTYDAESCVGATIEALLPQLDEADELIVVDNASRDGTLREVEAAAAGARVLQMGSNRGFSAACNAGAAVSEARLLLFLNPDVRVEPGALAALRATAQEQPGWGAWQALVTLDNPIARFARA
jgi:GT2 family glycosyltransferase